MFTFLSLSLLLPGGLRAMRDSSHGLATAKCTYTCNIGGVKATHTCRENIQAPCMGIAGQSSVNVEVNCSEEVGEDIQECKPDAFGGTFHRIFASLSNSPQNAHRCGPASKSAIQSCNSEVKPSAGKQTLQPDPVSIDERTSNAVGKRNAPFANDHTRKDDTALTLADALKAARAGPSKCTYTCRESAGTKQAVTVAHTCKENIEAPCTGTAREEDIEVEVVCSKEVDEGIQECKRNAFAGKFQEKFANLLNSNPSSQSARKCGSASRSAIQSCNSQAGEGNLELVLGAAGKKTQNTAPNAKRKEIWKTNQITAPFATGQKREDDPVLSFADALKAARAEESECTYTCREAGGKQKVGAKQRVTVTHTCVENIEAPCTGEVKQEDVEVEVVCSKEVREGIQKCNRYAFAGKFQEISANSKSTLQNAGSCGLAAKLAIERCSSEAKTSAGKPGVSQIAEAMRGKLTTHFGVDPLETRIAKRASVTGSSVAASETLVCTISCGGKEFMCWRSGGSNCEANSEAKEQSQVQVGVKCTFGDRQQHDECQEDHFSDKINAITSLQPRAKQMCRAKAPQLYRQCTSN